MGSEMCIRDRYKARCIRLNWIKAHAGYTGNETAEQLANTAANTNEEIMAV